MAEQAHQEVVSVVIGTAGHIDHGKSTLVQRLTGIHPDRLKEEQERGLTIDLGFAPLTLKDGRRVGIIDVPGHERFVKNMVAGATGVDLVLFIVAADDGVMPQTREHLEILRLLGLEHGIVVITKIDASGVDGELIEVLELELSELLAGTFLEKAPVVKVSSITGEGIDRLLDTIAEQIATTPRRSDQGAFRMPVQRVFSAQGFGTILTGVPLSGTVTPGEVVEVITADGQRHRGKIRGTQAYGRKVDRVRAGHSSALNVADVDKKLVARGDTVCTPGIFTAETMWEVRLTHVSSQRRPLEQRETIRFHVGTSEVLGEVVLLDRESLLPGESGLCQLRLHGPVVAAAGDRFVLRRHSPMEMVGGGVVLGASKWRLKPGKGFVLERLASKEHALGSGKDALLVELRESRSPLKRDDLVRALGRSQDEVDGLIAEAVAAGAAIEASGGKGTPVWVATEVKTAAEAAVEAALAAWHRAHPARAACPRQELRQTVALHDGLFTTVIDGLVGQKRLVVGPHGPALASHVVTLDDKEQALAAALVARFNEAAWQPPTPAQALATDTPAGLDPDRAQDVVLHLTESGQLVDIGDELVFHRARYDEAKEIIRREVKKHGSIAAAALKDLIGSSRRYTIPLLEHLDEVGFTKREGDVRTLREGV